MIPSALLTIQWLARRPDEDGLSASLIKRWTNVKDYIKDVSVSAKLLSCCILVLVCWISCPFTIVDTSLFAHSSCSLSTWNTLSFSHFSYSVPFLSGYVLVWFSSVAFLPVHQFLLFFFFLSFSFCIIYVFTTFTVKACYEMRPSF